MSDINPNRMIPLYVADQAVAACEKEIAQLKAEVERLRESASSIISILCQHVPDSNLRNLALREWKTAKEGKPSV